MSIDTSPPAEALPDVAANLPEDADQWSAKLRRAAVEVLPPSGSCRTANPRMSLHGSMSSGS